MSIERGDSPSGGAPEAPSAGANDLRSRSADVFGDSATPESGPYLKPNETLAAEAYAVGQVLAGKYRVDRLIGEGAMGLVLAATHLGLDEVVAIKFMRAEIQRVAGTLSRFAKEAKIAARIRSEHVIKVIDVGVSDPIGPYIVMEYLDGRTLAEVLDTEGPLSVQRAAEYLLQACEGLAAAHALGVTHRDIKPDNLFITGQHPLEVVKVLDFGISKATLTGRVFGDDLALNQSSYVMGTPLYMSPEQIRAAPHVDCRTDIWSLGAVLYELVSGRTAFSADSMTEICAKILETPAPRLADPCPRELAAVQSVIAKCLEKEPERRFQSVADLALALLPLASERARAYADRSSNLLGATRPSATSAEPLAQLPASERGQPEPEQPPSRRRSRAPKIALGLAALGLLMAIAMRFAPLGPELVSVPLTLNPGPAQSRPEPVEPSEPQAVATGAGVGSVEPGAVQVPKARPSKEQGAPSKARADHELARAARPKTAPPKAREDEPANEQPRASDTIAPSQSSDLPLRTAVEPSPIRLVDTRSRLRLVAPPPLLAPSSDVTEPSKGDSHVQP